MLPSSTVENYLKAILQNQKDLPPNHTLVPMGHIAATLNVTPGTATTMIKALAESGLVFYEPYSGVRLTEGGQKLAALVLRRHRLVELFLVEVMGMSWAEVHEEAELLEHVVSDRLIERIDAMLGRPKVDPHGDPIPDPEGTLEEVPHPTLLTCPLGTPVTVTRISDQDGAFLRFVETSGLKPGQSVEVEARDPAADSVLIRAKDGRHVTVGTRAASKLLVEVLQTVLMLLVFTGIVFNGIGLAQTPAPSSTAASRPFEITDNSFLIEEAFNQESGIFQNIATFTRGRNGTWGSAFTQEWPLGGQTHQFSYVLTYLGAELGSGMGDTLINYRFQALLESETRPAFSPRLSLLVPTGEEPKGLGGGSAGVQFNLPFSKQFGDVYLHWNAGVTHLPRVRSLSPTARVALTTPVLGMSAIWRATPMLNLMMETVAEFEESIEGSDATTRSSTVTISPGFRGGWNIGSKQLIIGAAVPVTIDSGRGRAAVLGYFSYELPFSQ